MSMGGPTSGAVQAKTLDRLIITGRMLRGSSARRWEGESNEATEKPPQDSLARPNRWKKPADPQLTGRLHGSLSAINCPGGYSAGVNGASGFCVTIVNTCPLRTP
jgi:hypothetical protein